MKDKIEKCEDLNSWQEGIDIVVKVYSALKDCKDYGLRDQMQGAVVSIPSNIAEGFDRKLNKEFIRFLRIPKASCAELRTQLIIAKRISLFDSGILIEDSRKLSAMISRMISSREIF